MNYAENTKGLVINKQIKEELIVGLRYYIDREGRITHSGICHGISQGIRKHFEYPTNSHVFYGMYHYFNIICLSKTKLGEIYGFNYVRKQVSEMLLQLFSRDDFLIYTDKDNEYLRIVCKSDEARDKVFEIRKFVYENTTCDGSLGKPLKIRN